MNDLPPIYFVPGLGADSRLFEGLRRQGLPFKVIEFLRPEKKEPLSAYAARMAQQVDTSRPYVIGGVSLGGIISVEMAKFLQPQKVIAISTIKSHREFPFYLKTFRYLPIQKAFSGQFLIRNAPREKRKLMEPWQADLLEEMRMEADPHLVKWGIQAVLKWRNKDIPDNVIHFHGSRDGLFPKRFIRNKVLIEDGTHVMVLTHAEQLAAAIKQELSLFS